MISSSMAGRESYIQELCVTEFVHAEQETYIDCLC